MKTDESLAKVSKLDFRLRRVRLFDLELFYAVGRTNSLRVVARSFSLEPSQVSRTIAALEKTLETKLFLRSNSGSILTPAGRRVHESAQAILNQSQFLKSTDQKPTESFEILGICTANYLAENFLPDCIEKFRASDPKTRFRILELYPDQMLQPSMRGAFDCALHVDKINWPATWDTTEIGKLRWHFCCRPGHPLTRTSVLRQSDLVRFPFITPFDFRQEGSYQFRDDRCPIPWNLRNSGEEVQRADVAARVITKTDQLGYLPDISLQGPLQRGEICLLHPIETPEVWVPLNLSLHASHFPNSFKNRLVKAMKDVFERIKVS